MNKYITDAMVERGFEKVAERLLLKAIRQFPGDVNAQLKYFFREILGITDPQVLTYLSSLPGFDYMANALMLMLSVVVERRVDSLWSNKTGPEWQQIRAALKLLAPAIRGVGEGVADAAQHLNELTDKVDDVVSSSSTRLSDRKADLDYVVLITLPGFGAARPFYPVSLDASGMPEVDASGNVVVRHAEYNAFVHHHVTNNMVTRGGQSKKGGGRTPVSTSYPAPITRVCTLQEWATEASGVAVDPRVAAQIMEAFKPKEPKATQGWWPSLDQHSRDVFMAVAPTMVDHEDWVGYSEREQFESLVEAMKAAKPDPLEVCDALKRLTIQPDGTLDQRDFKILKFQVDVWLGGNQTTTQEGWNAAVHIIKSLPRRGLSWGWIGALLTALGGGSLIPLFLLVGLFLFGVFGYIKGVSMSLVPIGALDTGIYLNQRACWSIFVVILLLTLFNGKLKLWEPEAFKKIMNKLQIFCFLLPGLNSYAMLFNFSPMDRMLVVNAIGMTIAAGTMYVDAGQREKLIERLMKSMPLFIFFTAIVPLALLFIKNGGIMALEIIPPTWFATAYHWVNASYWNMAVAVVGSTVVGLLLWSLVPKKESAATTLVGVRKTPASTTAIFQKGFKHSFIYRYGGGLLFLALLGLALAWAHTYTDWFEGDTSTTTVQVSAPAAQAPVRQAPSQRPSATGGTKSLQWKCDNNELSFRTCRQLRKEGKIN